VGAKKDEEYAPPLTSKTALILLDAKPYHNAAAG
jgi:hypothetical protein